MIPKYTVEYTTQFQNHLQPAHFSTDDPITCEEFVSEVLDRSLQLRAIKHEGVELSRHDFDKIVKKAAALLAAKRICASLGIKSEEELYRFGFTA